MKQPIHAVAPPIAQPILSRDQRERSWPAITRRAALAGIAAPLAAPLFAQRREPSRSNILLILAEDLGAWMLGCYGNREIRTPNIDRLAQAGVRFLNHFTTTPASSPSCATMLTGRLPRQHGILDSLAGQPVTASLAKEALLSDLLSAQGYQCGHLGRWTLGGDAAPGHGLQFTYTVAEPLRYQDPAVFLNGKPVQERGYLTELITAQALRFLDQQTPGKPFFLTAAYPNPSEPYEGHPQKSYDLYAQAKFEGIGWQPAASNALRGKEYLADTVGNIRKAAASISALDDQIPRLLAKLTERKLAGDTLVVFTSSHGALFGRHGLWGQGQASDPINMYEEVVQTPLLLHWLGKLPVEAVRPEMCSLYDFFPTLCEVAGIEVSEKANLCGHSYLTLAQGKPLPRRQTWQTTVFGHHRNTEMARDTRFKLVLRDAGAAPGELYDLRADARERVNQYDNPEFITVRERLAKEIEAWRKRYV